MTLTWNASTGATSYNIYGCGFADTSATTTYVCTRPTSGTYTVTVTGVNAGGESPPSNSVSVTPRPPSPPTNLVGTPGNRTIVLTWDAMAGATSYSISGCGASITPSANPTGTTATCGNLTNGTNYTVSVTANGPGGSSTASTVTVAVPWQVVHSGNNGLTQVWSNPPDTAVPNNYSFSSCSDSLNSPNITCGYSGGNLTMSTNRNTPLGPVTLTWTFTRNGRPDVIYTETFIIS